VRMNTKTKAACIRKVLEDFGPDLPLTEVREHLSKHGITDVSPQQVSNERAKLSKRRTGITLDDLPVSVLKKVKALADEIGSDAVRRALDELDNLASPTRKASDDQPSANPARPKDSV
jgi:hypothetical protein